MPPSLFQYAWTHSRPTQLLLLAITIASFPIAYVALEIPKRIVNEAIGGGHFPIVVLGVDFEQLAYLGLLCGLFLLAVVVSGLIKMQLNIMKGVLSERLLRRFRYQLISRIHRFPLARFRRKSQGELVSMVTAETEPLGGLMGDLIAEPVFQTGQMLTILLFLTIQNPWLALAAVALIPVQAYLIPLLQRRINRLNKERVVTVRELSTHIGESADAMPDIRANHMAHYFLSRFSDDLHRLFKIRYKIYRIKFFMKFLNNFLNQLTPFFFFSIGGYLVIEGQLTLGALVAALAAFKDLSAPWKDLLNYYNRLADMSVRYQAIIDQFDPPGAIPETQFEGRPTTIPRLTHPVTVEDATVLADDGSAVLENLSFEIPSGATALIACRDPAERQALSHMLTGLAPPRVGRVLVGGYDLGGLHQDVLGRRIGLVHDAPKLFDASLGFNITAALRTRPLAPETWTAEMRARAAEAERVGNSADPLEASWLDPTLAGVSDTIALREWWMEGVEAMGLGGATVRRALDAAIDPRNHPELCDAVVALRPDVARRLAKIGLSDVVTPFDAAAFHPGLSMGQNMLFAVGNPWSPRVDAASRLKMAARVAEMGHLPAIRAAAIRLVEKLAHVFEDAGPDHPILARMPIDLDAFRALRGQFLDGAASARAEEDVELQLLTELMDFTSAHFPDGVDAHICALLVKIRREHGAELRAVAGDAVSKIAADLYTPGLTLLDNAVYGKAPTDGPEGAGIRDAVFEILVENGLKSAASITFIDVEAGMGGSALPPFARESVAFLRAVAKRPDILVLERFLASTPQPQREHALRELRRLLPETTMIVLEPTLSHSVDYDMAFEIASGRLVGHPQTASPRDARERSDLEKKVETLRKTPLFAQLPNGQLRLLAFASEWFQAPAGKVIFRASDPTDSVYVIQSGSGMLQLWGGPKASSRVHAFEAGDVIGDVSAMMERKRAVDMVAVSDIAGLKIRAQEFVEIAAHDPNVARRLLQTYAGYVLGLLEVQRDH